MCNEKKEKQETVPQNVFDFEGKKSRFTHLSIEVKEHMRKGNVQDLAKDFHYIEGDLNTSGNGSVNPFDMMCLINGIADCLEENVDEEKKDFIREKIINLLEDRYLLYFDFTFPLALVSLVDKKNIQIKDKKMIVERVLKGVERNPYQEKEDIRNYVRVELIGILGRLNGESNID